MGEGSLKKGCGAIVIILIIMALCSTTVVSATDYDYYEVPFEDTDSLSEGWYIWYRVKFESGKVYKITLQVPAQETLI